MTAEQFTKTALNVIDIEKQAIDEIAPVSYTHLTLPTIYSV